MNEVTLSPTQRRVWIADQLAGEMAVYVIPFGLRLRGELDPRRLRQALDAVLARHPMLSARITAGPDGPRQWVTEPERVDLPLTDLSGTPASEREARMREVAEAEVRRTFDLARAPPFRTRLVRLDTGDHLLLWPIHHLVCDGISLRILARDLGRAYENAASGEGRRLPPPAATFLDLSRAEWSPESELIARRDLDYWRDRLAGAPDTLTIPGDRGRPALQSFVGVTAHSALTGTLVAEVGRLARAARTTPFTVYSAAFHAWIARYSGQAETVVGFAVDGRRAQNSEDVVGLFANLLVQRADTTDDPTARTLLSRVHTDLVGAHKHDRLRLDCLVEDSGRLDRHPVFQCLIDYHGYQRPELRFSEAIEAEPLLFDTATARFDLELSLRQRTGDESLCVALKCNADIFNAETAARMAAHYSHFLAAFVAAPDERVALLPLMPPPERAAILARAKGSSAPEPPWRTLQDAIEGASRAAASRCAVRADGRDHSYGALARRSASIAAALRRLGVGPDSIVAVCAPRGFDLVAGLLGVLRSGGAFLPLDPEDPSKRLQALIDDARPDLVLAASEVARQLGTARRLVELDEIAESPSAAGFEEPDIASPGPDHLAYILYTSGSTGRPKPVGISHGAILNRLAWMQRAYALAPGETVLQKTPVGFDVSVWELFWPLAFGGQLVMAPPGIHRDADALAALIVREEIRIVHFVPSMLHAFLENGNLASLAGVRLIVTSGEPLPTNLADHLVRGCRADIANLYGPTEAAIDVTAFDVRETRDSASVPIGRPIDNTQIHVLDQWMEPVPTGVVGEIWIGGVQVARGYVGRPALTAECFVADPFGPPGARLYRTGDLARVRADGLIEFVGRSDDQIKINGCRVEPGEIEAALLGIDGIAQAAVRLDDSAHGARLVAVVAVRLPELTPDALRSTLAQRIPLPMIPSEFVLVDAIPLLPNGKLDRRGLREVRSYALDNAQCDRARPSTPDECLVAQAWRAVLGTADNDIDRSFFTAGGDSIRSIGLVAELRSRGLDVTVADVFRHSTIRSLAAHASQCKRANGRQPVAAAYSGETGSETLPLSRLLAQLVAASVSRTDYRAYLTAIRLTGPFCESALRRATAFVMAQHPSLRSAIVFEADAAVAQRVHPHVEPSLVVTDWRQLDPSAQERRLARWFSEERARRFDWSTPPLWRLMVHRLSDEAWSLTLVEPFLDGWSATLLLTQLVTAYGALIDGRAVASSQPDSDVQTTFLQNEMRLLRSADARVFWRARMEALPATRLPCLAAKPSRAPVRHEVELPPGLSHQLLAVADELSVSVKSVLLAAHVRTLAALTGQAEVATALMANARPETEAGGNAIGLFLNAVPIRAALARHTWRRLIEDMHAAEAEALAFRAYPFAQMLEDAGTDFASDAVFNFTDFYPYRRFGDGSAIQVVDVRGFDQTYFPLTAQFRRDVAENTIRLALEFGREVDDQARSDVARCYRETLSDLAARPDGACAWWPRAVPPMAPRPAAADCLHLAFARQAAETPMAPAILSDTGDWTYADLRTLVDALAGRLRAVGVGRGRRVAVCMERSPHLVASALAILSVGGAYVPLDPAHPDQRLAELYGLAGCSVVLATRATVGRLPGRPLICADDGDHPAVEAPEPVAYDPEAPAYVIFTSGSTGVPRAAIVPHRAVMSRLAWQWRTDPFEPGEVGSMRTPIGFVDSFCEMWATLLRGFPTMIVDDNGTDPARLVSALGSGGATRVTLTPSMLSEVLRLPIDLAASLPRLRRWSVSGEPFPVSLARELLSRIPGVRIVNLYGSTEVAADVTWHRVTGTEVGPSVPIGRPIDGVHVVVLDALGNAAEPGVEGELAIGGAAVGTGYLDDPVLTAERFVPDAIGMPGARLYLTGDLARVEHDGTLVCTGRADRQVKIRGIRVHPMEAEIALREQPGVLRAAVVGARDVSGETRLTAYVELDSNCHGGISPDRLQRRLREALFARLPSAAVPSDYCIVDTWPRSPNGKLDTAALPRPLPRFGDAAPETPVERALADLWQTCLGAERVSRYDDFFALGGHSMRAIRLCSAISARFGIELDIADIFDRATLLEQANLVEDRLTVRACEPVPDAEPHLTHSRDNLAPTLDGGTNENAGYL
ncbi:non-ribosomal peptide synthetase [Microvirga calopogonii]|uniref:non-ribosomal peptide synthetase n=1 Tax=Microvirga calopogonii TaxID=2078013 RepID=UPI000E0CE112|nr:non-ribosomal peptide synthetase [Microvirga calopogonii]